MAFPSLENTLLRKTRILTQALILSGTLNIGLLTTFVYFVLKDKQKTLSIELQPITQHTLAEKPTNFQLLQKYSQLPFQELLLRLENKELLEEGLCSRDLSLSCLVAFHHFNLEKALCTAPLQKRSIPFVNSEGEEQIEVPVFPGLSDDQFQAILHYARTEKWPLTAQGLLYEIKRSPRPLDHALIETFCLTSEYLTIDTLFSKSGLPLPREQLVSILAEGEWRLLSDFVQTQRQALDLSPDCRRSFLFAYLHVHSPTAALLFLENDLEFVLKRFDDTHILSLLDYCDGRPACELFAKKLLLSPRTDLVWKKAASILYTLAHEPVPEPYDHAAVLTHFFPAAIPQTTVSPTKEVSVAVPQKVIYTIEPGDTLWKIARKFRVSIDEIKRANHLETEKLRCGKQIEIPQKG